MEFQSAADSPPEMPQSKRSREKSSPIPFSSTKKDQDDGVDSFDRPTALPHFKILWGFVNKYLGKQIQLYNRLRNGKEERVAFENLWMLFDSKDTIYCPLRRAGLDIYSTVGSLEHRAVGRHTPQAYRVVATAGGLSFARIMTPTSGLNEDSNPSIGAEINNEVNNIANVITQAQAATISRKARDSYSDFYVYCFFVDFNGIEYGMVREVFYFKPYERDIDIRTLQAYPAQFSTQNDMFLNRGKSFIDATNVSHMQYEGPTAGPNREDVSRNGPFVVLGAFGLHNL